MRFELVKQVDGKVNAYEGKRMQTGDAVEFSDVFSEKAAKNPDYKRVGIGNDKDTPKRKYTRKVKMNDGRGDS